jgi:beta-1,4-mannosyltransferase
MRVFLNAPVGKNPYMYLLSSALRAQGVQAMLPAKSGGWLPVGNAPDGDGPPDLVHLQWLERYLVPPTPQMMPRTLVRTARLYLQLARLRQQRRPIVWTVHNLHNHEQILPAYELWHYRTIARWADRLILHCERVKPLVANTFAVAPSKLRVIPLGDYGEWFQAQGIAPLARAEARRQLGLLAEQRVFLLFGALRAYKGASDLAEAFSNLPGDRFRLYMVGQSQDAHMRQFHSELARRDARLTVISDYVPDADLCRLLAACNVAALPYRDVLTSSALNMAASQARAAVIPQIGCMHEFGEDVALPYDPAAPNGLATALQRAAALSDEELDRLGANAQAKVRSLPWSQVATMAREVYRECLTTR